MEVSEPAVGTDGDKGRQVLMQNGDFVEIEFTGRVESGEVFDTTDEAAAKAAGIKLEKPGPVLVIVGGQMVVPGVTEQLLEMKVGEERSFAVPVMKAFGPRQPQAMKVISLAKFLNEKMMPTPGEILEIDGARAKVLSVSGGRVRVDFNHPLSGKALNYTVKVVRQVTEPLEKARKLLDHYGLPCTVALAEGKLAVTTEKAVPPMVQKLFEQKLKEHVPEVKEVVFAAPEPATPTTGPAGAAPAAPGTAETAHGHAHGAENAEKAAPVGAGKA